MHIIHYEDYDYIRSSKIYFDLETKEPIIFSQKSIKEKKERAYIIQNRNININIKKDEDLKLFPALFIFLIDQSGSMGGNEIKLLLKHYYYSFNPSQRDLFIK